MKFLERGEPRLVGHQVQEGGALASGDDEPVEIGEMRDATDLDGLRGEAGKRLRVGFEVPLQRQHSDPRHDDPLPAARLKQLGLGQLRRFDPMHRGAQASRGIRDRLRVLVVRGRPHDRLGAHRRIFRLEDA